MSVIVYAFCIILCRVEQAIPVYLSIILEVALYTIVSIYFTGWDCGSVYFLFGIVPLIIYFGYGLFGTRHIFSISLLLGMDFTLFLILYFNLYDKVPRYFIPNSIRHALIILAAFSLVFGAIFYSAVYIYSAEYKAASLQKEKEQLIEDAKTDTLTHLLNRRGFLSVIEELMKKDVDAPFCIAFCDIDNFKRVNDNYGHDCGDEVLRHVTKIVRKEMTGCEVCRWGGEEIVILMRDYDFEVAKSKMEYIRNTVEQSKTIFYNKRIGVTLTIGLETNRMTYKKPEEIITKADKRMYWGKQHGRNIVVYEDKEGMEQC